MQQKRNYKNSELLKRFLPYYKKYIPTVVFDLFCASLTTVCEIILPLIMRNLTDAGINDTSLLSVQYILRIGLIYFAFRIIDSAAYYYMAYVGHVMGTKIETICSLINERSFEWIMVLSINYQMNY